MRSLRTPPWGVLAIVEECGVAVKEESGYLKRKRKNQKKRFEE